MRRARTGSGVKVARVVTLTTWVAIALACDEPGKPLAPREPRAHAHMSAFVVDSGWNYFVADVSLTTDEPLATGTPPTDNTSEITYTLTRTLLEDSTWSVEVAFDAYRPVGDTLPGTALPDIARGVARLGAEAVFYDSRGGVASYNPERPPTPLEPDAPLPPPDGAPVPPPYPNDDASATGSPSVLAQTPQSSLTIGTSDIQMRDGRDVRGWADELLVTPATRARALVRVQSAFERRADAADGRARYVRRSGRMLIERIIDRHVGVATEENFMVDGKLVARKLSTFEAVDDTTFLRTATRYELPPRPGNSQPRSYTHATRNVRFLRRAGQ